MIKQLTKSTEPARPTSIHPDEYFCSTVVEKSVKKISPKLTNVKNNSLKVSTLLENRSIFGFAF